MYIYFIAQLEAKSITSAHRYLVPRLQSQMNSTAAQFPHYIHIYEDFIRFTVLYRVAMKPSLYELISTIINNSIANRGFIAHCEVC